MRKWIVICMGMLMLLSLPLVFLTGNGGAGVATEEQEEIPAMKEGYRARNYDDMKAMWLSQFDLHGLYCVNGQQRAPQEFRSLLVQMLDRVVQLGINTVIVQVRPYMDSMYPSEVYPMSKYVVGAYGVEAIYDPFSILLEEAHARQLSVHAWINPLRGMLTDEIAQVDPRYAVRRFYDDPIKNGTVLVHSDERWYLNPAYEEARALIVAGAREIVNRYEVDGLHMDDYFYPSGCGEVFDAVSYLHYCREGGELPLQAYRREQVNTLVRELYAAVKDVREDVLFGISPGGNMNTNYHHLGADVYTWCSQPGYIDYICPQVYWGMEHETYDFVSVCRTFDEMITLDSVRLIIGMTVSKAKTGYDRYAGSGQHEWAQHKDILYRCLQHTRTLQHCAGVSYFCYQYFYDPLTGESVKETETERELFVPLLKEITW